MKEYSRIVAALALVGLYPWTDLSASAALASIEEDLPLEVEDAYPTGYLNREIQAIGRYERTADGEDLWLLESRLEYGLARNWETSLHVPFEFGNGTDKEGLQDVSIDALYNFNTETRFLPALSLSAGAKFPTGDKSRGVDTALKVLLTRTLGWSTLLHRVHLNVAWFRNAEARNNERTNHYKAVAGYDVRLGPDTLLIFDYVWEEEIEQGVTANLVETGVKQMLNPLTAVSAGIGFGLDDDAPDFRATLGLQRSF